jgi:hypothetical protein
MIDYLFIDYLPFALRTNSKLFNGQSFMNFLI